MRIARYFINESIRYGVVELAEDNGDNPDTIGELRGDPLSSEVTPTGVRHQLEEVRLLAPVLPRSKVIGLAKNAVPGQDQPPEPTAAPTFFLKPNTSVIGPGEQIQIPAMSDQVVMEAELAVVIGRICRLVPPQRVPDVIFGYTASNDVTAMDQIKDGFPWGASKCWDTFTPLGPWIVTDLSTEQASGLSIRGRIDDEAVTNGTTSGLIHGIVPIITFISSIMTLLPGDVILTGAPGGSATIVPGQTCCVEIDQVGSLRNPVAGPF